MWSSNLYPHVNFLLQLVVMDPGHSAKNGSYGIIHLTTSKVLHIELVQVCTYGNAFKMFTLVNYHYSQSNEVKSSNYMDVLSENSQIFS